MAHMDIYNDLLLALVAKICVSLDVNVLYFQNVLTSGWFLSHICRIICRQYSATQYNPYLLIEVNELLFRNQGSYSN